MILSLKGKRTATGLGLALAVALVAQAGTSQAQERHRIEGQGQHVESQRDPMGYSRLDRPDGIDARPQTFDRPGYTHNFQAVRNFRIGPYHAPAGWKYNRFYYGQILPPLFWAEQYWLSDYWLFALDVPPIGYEWVRYGPDAILVNVHTGEIIQVVYDTFR